MRFNVSDLMQDSAGASRSFDLDAECAVGEGESRRVTGAVELLRTNLGLVVRAHLRTEEQEVCSRCLRPLREEVPLDFEEEYRKAAEPDVEGDFFLIEEEQMLDLGEAVRQYRETALAMAPLCRPDCKGLCPVCGRDLNQGPCGCDVETDSRWSALATLKGDAADGRE